MTTQHRLGTLQTLATIAQWRLLQTVTGILATRTLPGHPHATAMSTFLGLLLLVLSQDHLFHTPEIRLAIHTHLEICILHPGTYTLHPETRILLPAIPHLETCHLGTCRRETLTTTGENLIGTTETGREGIHPNIGLVHHLPETTAENLLIGETVTLIVADAGRRKGVVLTIGTAENVALSEIAGMLAREMTTDPFQENDLANLNRNGDGFRGHPSLPLVV